MDGTVLAFLERHPEFIGGVVVGEETMLTTVGILGRVEEDEEQLQIFLKSPFTLIGFDEEWLPCSDDDEPYYSAARGHYSWYDGDNACQISIARIGTLRIYALGWAPGEVNGLALPDFSLVS